MARAILAALSMCFGMAVIWLYADLAMLAWASGHLANMLSQDFFGKLTIAHKRQFCLG